MSHDSRKSSQEASLIGRIFSLEALLMLMGIASLIYGLVQHTSINIFWGIVIIPGVIILSKVRRKDWAKHWEELEKQQAARTGQPGDQPPPTTPEDHQS